MDREQAPNHGDALYDFLYLDRERIAAYTAQFDDLGVLTETKKTGAHSSTETTTGTLGIPQVASGAVAENSTATSTIDRRYDTRYTIPLDLIDSLADSGMIETEVATAAIGGVVSIEGDVVAARRASAQRPLEADFKTCCSTSSFRLQRSMQRIRRKAYRERS